MINETAYRQECPITLSEVQGGDELEELAEILKVPKSWLYTRTKTNSIPHFRVGRYCRFRWSEVWNWLEKQQNQEGKNGLPAQK
ncbi:helix-turn-helix domain-containing protein [Desulfococcaceae bacterium HSG8]|nr:helix-turn-helix domain-containing protein [Desulfococcaceae bacterium HSG8]